VSERDQATHLPLKRALRAAGGQIMEGGDLHSAPPDERVCCQNAAVERFCNRRSPLSLHVNVIHALTESL
jgi:hypothetical protein